MIKAIIFDFAGVIGSEGYWLWLKENITNLNQTKDFFERLSHDVDRGTLAEKEFVAILAQKSGKPADTIISEIFEKIEINPKILGLMRKLRKNYKVALLTNFLNELITQIIQRHSLAQYFDEMVISSREKIIKPDPEIFMRTLERLGVEPVEALFIDDRQLNVDGSLKVGMKGLVYTTDKKLLEDLQALGIKV